MKSSSFFNANGDSFFSVLNSKNKEVYLDCLLLIYTKIDKSGVLELDRDTIIATIKNYLLKNKMTLDEEDNDKETNDDASYILRRFKDCGWLTEEVDASYNRNFAFTPFAVKLIKLISEYVEFVLEEDDETEKEKASLTVAMPVLNPLMGYEGYVYGIYNSLKYDDRKEPKLLIGKIYQDMVGLHNALMSIYSSIKAFIDQTLRKTSAEDILALHFDQYLNDPTSKIYKQLRTTENIDKYKTQISNYLYDLRRDKEFVKDFDNTELAYFNKIIEFFDITLEELTRQIDDKNSEYIRSTINRIKFITNHKNDVAGELTQILKYISTESIIGNMDIEDTDLPIFEGLIKMGSIRYIDEKTPYVVKTRAKIVKTPQVISPIIYSQEEARKLAEEMRDNTITIESTNKHVDILLWDKLELRGKDFPLKGTREFLDFIATIAFSNSENVIYELKVTDDTIVKDNTKFKDFVIRRK